MDDQKVITNLQDDTNETDEHTQQEFNFNDYFQRNIASSQDALQQVPQEELDQQSSAVDALQEQDLSEYEDLMDELEETVQAPGSLNYQPPAPKATELFTPTTKDESPMISESEEEETPMFEQAPILESQTLQETHPNMEKQPRVETIQPLQNTSVPEDKKEESQQEASPTIEPPKNTVIVHGVPVEKNVAPDAEKITTIADLEEAYFIDKVHEEDQDIDNATE